MDGESERVPAPGSFRFDFHANLLRALITIPESKKLATKQPSTSPKHVNAHAAMPRTQTHAPCSECSQRGAGTGWRRKPEQGTATTTSTTERAAIRTNGKPTRPELIPLSIRAEAMASVRAQLAVARARPGPLVQPWPSDRPHAGSLAACTATAAVYIYTHRHDRWDRPGSLRIHSFIPCTPHRTACEQTSSRELAPSIQAGRPPEPGARAYVGAQRTAMAAAHHH